MDLKNAYEKHSGLLKYNRTVQFDRKSNRIICTDDIEMRSNTDEIEFSFMTPCQTNISENSIDFIKDNEQIANMEYDGSKLIASEEKIKFRCERLSEEWNNYLKRLILKLRKPERKFKAKFIIS